MPITLYKCKSLVPPPGLHNDGHDARDGSHNRAGVHHQPPGRPRVLAILSILSLLLVVGGLGGFGGGARGGFGRLCGGGGAVHGGVLAVDLHLAVCLLDAVVVGAVVVAAFEGVSVLVWLGVLWDLGTRWEGENGTMR